MKLSDAFPTRFVSGKELTKPITITIARIESEPVRDMRTGNTSQRLVIYAAGAKRGILITKTLATQMREIFGDDIEIEGLPGRRLVIYPQRHTSGNIMICARAATEAAASIGAGADAGGCQEETIE
jgi:hypothetical protein